MKVSIVCPVFNKEAYVGAALESALHQSYSDIEVIAVDDASTDGSAAVLSKMAKSDRRLAVHTRPNGGLSAARNTGIDLATGDYIFFHDADDLMEPDAIEHLVSLAKTHGSDIVGGIFRQHRNGKTTDVERFQFDQPALDFATDVAAAERYCLNFSSCNKMFSSAFLREADLRFTEGLYMQDIEFWLKAMFLSRNVTQSAKVVSNYIAYEDSSSRVLSEARFDSVFRLYDRLDDFYRTHDLTRFAEFRDHALMQGAIMFFARWKLRDWSVSKDGADLNRLQGLLRHIPASHFFSFMSRQNRGPTGPVLMLLREGNFGLALEALNARPIASHLVKLLEANPNPSRLPVLFEQARALARKPNIAVRTWRKARSSLIAGLLCVDPSGRTIDRLKSVRDAVVGSTRKPAKEAPPSRGLRAKGKRFLVFGLGDLYNIGGVQLSYKRLFEHLTAAGHEVAFYSHREKPDGAQLYYPLPDGVTVEHYRLQDTPKAKAQIADIAKECDPDCVLIVGNGQGALILGAALHGLPYPVIYSERGSPEHCLSHNWTSKTQREVLYRAVDFLHVLMPGYVLAVPEPYRQTARAISSVTEPGTGRAKSSQANTDGRFTILYTGRMSFEKDLDLLIEAFSRVASDHKAWDLHLIGDGPDRPQLEAQSQRLGLGGRIVFHGSAEDVEAVFAAYRSANLFVLPSRAEGCPLSLREAMAHGLPVIGFADCSGTNEIIFDGRNGLLAPADDKVGRLAAALTDLIEDPQRRDAFGAAGIKDVERYAPQTIHDAWESLLLEAASYKGRRQELRDAERAIDPQLVDHHSIILDAVLSSGQCRAIAAYEGDVRSATAPDDLTAAYLLTFGSPLFDPNWYYAQDLAVKLSGLDPLEHYLTTGWRDGRKPHPDAADTGEQEKRPFLVRAEIERREWDTASDELSTAHALLAMAEGGPTDKTTTIDQDAVADALRRQVAWKPFDLAQLSAFLKR